MKNNKVVSTTANKKALPRILVVFLCALLSVGLVPIQLQEQIEAYGYGEEVGETTLEELPDSNGTRTLYDSGKTFRLSGGGVLSAAADTNLSAVVGTPILTHIVNNDNKKPGNVLGNAILDGNQSPKTGALALPLAPVVIVGLIMSGLCVFRFGARDGNEDEQYDELTGKTTDSKIFNN
ncbi:hypothetical protein FACS1894111_07780 [Clostridia bacterium]|nr:hypothetical protein FACS1894111_07780 [Clostridia bacterium]